MANECVDARILEAKPGVLWKLDIVKAHDHVNWAFLVDMLAIGLRFKVEKMDSVVYNYC